MNTDSVTGIVLAGGRSRRMGTDKSVLKVNNKTLIEYSIDALRPLCSKVVIISNNRVYDYTGCEVWPDEIAGQAPMIGLWSALKRSVTEFNLVLSCDMPLINTGVLACLLANSEKHDITLPVHDNGLIEPLCGVYKQGAAAVLEKFIAGHNFRLIDCIRASSYQLIPIGPESMFFSPHLFLNINSSDDLCTFHSLATAGASTKGGIPPVK